MNLQLVPKYKKYNRTQSQLLVLSVPARFCRSLNHDQTEKIEKCNKRKYRKPPGRVRLGSVRTIPEKKNKNKKETKTTYNSDNGCAVVRWCRRRKALYQLKEDKIRRQKQAEEWRRWKKQEEERVERAKCEDRHEQARRELESEYACQAEVQNQKLARAYNPKLVLIDIEDEPPKKKKKNKKEKNTNQLTEYETSYYDGKPKGKKNKQRKTTTKDQKIKKIDLVQCRGEVERSRRFVDWFYRTCCQCFCLFSIFVIIGVAIIMVV
ncbi:hypothetical protein O0L34_g5536 [Tuta absoluta]|nr:hypothetical protein O0L34_g5536 [Tuta absoluta]